MTMQTSEEGEAFLDRQEGDVLKAYRDVAGVWTISKGLTKASGVVDPKPGMVITKEESLRLTRLALRRNYEPTVNAVLPDVQQHVFDGAVSFHWNTGAIRKASWVGHLKAGRMPGFEAAMRLWNKAGGKVVAGLVNRRNAEIGLIRYGDYYAGKRPAVSPGSARFAVYLDVIEIAKIAADLQVLGYRPGPGQGINLSEVIRFQREHDLRPDGVIGRATLSTLQRMIDARSAPAKPAAATVGATVAAAGNEVASAPIPEWFLLLLLAVIAVWSLKLAWHYRDAVAAKSQRVAPGLARWLRAR